MNAWVEVRFLLDPSRLAHIMGPRSITDLVREGKNLSAYLVVDDPERASVTVGIQVRNHPSLIRAAIEGKTFAQQLMVDLLELDTDFVAPPEPVEIRMLDSDAEFHHMREAAVSS